jgi:hypothetical protein
MRKAGEVAMISEDGSISARYANRRWTGAMRATSENSYQAKFAEFTFSDVG